VRNISRGTVDRLADQYNEDPVCKALSLGLGLLGVRSTVDPPSHAVTTDATGKKTD